MSLLTAVAGGIRSAAFVAVIVVMSSLSTARAGDPASPALADLNQWLAQPRAARPPLANLPFAKSPLGKADATAALDALWLDRAALLRETRAAEMRDKVLELDGLKLRFEWLSFGDTNKLPTNGRSLFISMHGGGGAPTKVNDSQWTNQIKLGHSYKPAEGIYVAPRAPTDAWDMWHQANVDNFFARLIEDFVVFEGVNPNRVYVMGYSAGGDGVYQIAPRTPDRWAAASMMAGHPNESQPFGLRNLPFALQVGANDSAYNRNKVAEEYGRRLDALWEADPRGYPHFTQLYEGMGHWMKMEDRRAVPWMEKFTRQPLPEKVVWYQDDVTHTRSYWLARPADEVKAGQHLVATRAGQQIMLASTNVKTVTVNLSDALLDLDQPVVVSAGGRILFSNVVSRTIARLAETLDERGDRHLAFSASVTVALPSAGSAQARWWSDAAEQMVQSAGTNSVELVAALQAVPEAQREGLQFLIENMPEPDRLTLSAKFLLENVALAYEGLATAAWGKQIPREIFFNDVLPYASVNERRDAWRARLREICAPLVKDSTSPGAAAHLLNQKIFEITKVRYSTKRRRADQGPLESMESGMATCTGLSILLVDACRSVGIPARVAGTPMWTNMRGNHTWIEVWDDGWHFAGAAEPDGAGLDHGWFAHDASLATNSPAMHGIYASSFQKTGLEFPMVWARDIHWVNAVSVTDRYAQRAAMNGGTILLLVKVVDAEGKRVVANVTASDPGQPTRKFLGCSRGETADLNNILPIAWGANSPCELRIEHAGKVQKQLVLTQPIGQQVVTVKLDEAK